MPFVHMYIKRISAINKTLLSFVSIVFPFATEHYNRSQHRLLVACMVVSLMESWIDACVYAKDGPMHARWMTHRPSMLPACPRDV
jgi:threonine/homoserine/homoserine lactone efflux protein